MPSEIGSGERIRRSAASTSAARWSTAWPMRSVKKPTPVSAVTATRSAASSTASSPERQSRDRASSAKRSARIRSAPDLPPGVELDDASAARRDLAVVRDQHERRAVRRVEVEQELHHPMAGRGVEVAGRFVGEQHRRARHEGARDGDALLLAARELARVVAEAGLEADLLERGARRRPARRTGRRARAAASRSRAPSATAPGGRTGTRSRRGGRAPPRGRPRPARTAPCPRARRSPRSARRGLPAARAAWTSRRPRRRRRRRSRRRRRRG